MKKIKLAGISKFVLLKDIKPYPLNSKEHSPDQVELIKQSMENNGYYNAIGLDKKNVIIFGHARYYSLCEKHPDLNVEVEVREFDYSDLKVKKMRILDNRCVSDEYDTEKLQMDLSGIIKSFEHIDKEIGNQLAINQIELDNIIRANQEVDISVESEKKTTHKIDVKHKCPKCGEVF
jgi:ParB-like chromosome segregation protein Spo0J